LAKDQSDQREDIAGDRHGVFIENAPEAGIRSDRRLVEKAPLSEARLGLHLVDRSAQRHQVEDGRDPEDDIGDGER
jgi:hypothetical protein